MRKKPKSEEHERTLAHQKFIKDLMNKNKKWRKSKWNDKKKGKFKPSVSR